jgi:hypothetical protein
VLITLDIKNESMKDSFLNFIGTLDYIDIKSNDTTKLSNDKQPKQNKFNEFAGMWQDRDIDINSIRKEAWKK